MLAGWQFSGHFLPLFPWLGAAVPPSCLQLLFDTYTRERGREAQYSYSREETTISLFNHYLLEYLILLQPGGKT